MSRFLTPKSSYPGVCLGLAAFLAIGLCFAPESRSDDIFEGGEEPPFYFKAKVHSLKLVGAVTDVQVPDHEVNYGEYVASGTVSVQLWEIEDGAVRKIRGSISLDLGTTSDSKNREEGRASGLLESEYYTPFGDAPCRFGFGGQGTFKYESANIRSDVEGSIGAAPVLTCLLPDQKTLVLIVLPVDLALRAFRRNDPDAGKLVQTSGALRVGMKAFVLLPFGDATVSAHWMPKAFQFAESEGATEVLEIAAELRVFLATDWNLVLGGTYQSVDGPSDKNADPSLGRARYVGGHLGLEAGF